MSRLYCTVFPVIGNFLSKVVAMVYPFFQHARVRGPFLHVGSGLLVVVVALLSMSGRIQAVDRLAMQAKRAA
jgi:hypothetical protein